jgi:hypothetical protein
VSIRLLLILLCTALTAPAAERQHHGLVFEEWVRRTFFDGYTPEGYTQKWDIPAAANPKFGGIPVNPKAARHRGPVDLGDALRQFDIDEPFWLIVGYWDDADGPRRMVRITALRIEPADWRALWGGLTRADLERLDAVIKDRSLTPAQAREKAQALKTQPPYRDTPITLNPKIDHKSQRRLQCSLRFDVLHERLAARDSGPQDPPALWGVAWPGFAENDGTPTASAEPSDSAGRPPASPQPLPRPAKGEEDARPPGS